MLDFYIGIYYYIAGSGDSFNSRSREACSASSSDEISFLHLILTHNNGSERDMVESMETRALNIRYLEMIDEPIQKS